mmetsp:Transcript_6746/g.21760  ORF Transcript_6746/g.21760 Transcript_6746/m.21760 type:complete len:208 (-) Transcript_6746:182-805(-)
MTFGSVARPTRTATWSGTARMGRSSSASGWPGAADRRMVSMAANDCRAATTGLHRSSSRRTRSGCTPSSLSRAASTLRCGDQVCRSGSSAAASAPSLRRFRLLSKWWSQSRTGSRTKTSSVARSAARARGACSRSRLAAMWCDITCRASVGASAARSSAVRRKGWNSGTGSALAPRPNDAARSMWTIEASPRSSIMFSRCRSPRPTK